MKKIFLFSILSLFLFSSIVLASIPNTISIQGRLADATTNRPISNQVGLDATFEFCSSKYAGTACEASVNTKINTDSKGIFNADITVPNNIDFKQPWYIQVTIDRQVFNERVPLTSVAYAFNSKDTEADRWIDQTGDIMNGILDMNLNPLKGIVDIWMFGGSEDSPVHYNYIRFLNSVGNRIGGIMWNDDDIYYGDGNDFTIYSYDNRDLVLKSASGVVKLLDDLNINGILLDATEGWISLPGSAIRSPDALGFFNSNNWDAQQIRVGSLLVSNQYSDADKVPAKGIYSKGSIVTDDSLTTGGYLIVGGTDIKLGTRDSRPKGSKTLQRALVHYDNPPDSLYINFGGDFEGGTHVIGDLSVSGTLKEAGSRVCTPANKLCSASTDCASCDSRFVNSNGDVIDGDLRIGKVTDEDDATGENYGNKLIFSGGDDWDTWNSDNSDPLWIARYNKGNDWTELRVNVGDNTGDAFVIGSLVNSEFQPVFKVFTSGIVEAVKSVGSKFYAIGLSRPTSAGPMLYDQNGNALTLGGDSDSIDVTIKSDGNILVSTGNIFIEAVNKFLKVRRMYFQAPSSSLISWTRGLIGQNIMFDENEGKWVISPDGSQYTDFSMIRFENGGKIGFFTRSDASNSKYTLSDTELENYRRMTIDTDGNINIKSDLNVDDGDLNVDGNVYIAETAAFIKDNKLELGTDVTLDFNYNDGTFTYHTSLLPVSFKVSPGLTVAPVTNININGKEYYLVDAMNTDCDSSSASNNCICPSDKERDCMVVFWYAAV
ncbi:MAG: hypothetical protein J7K26_02185 [Candidatus Aenigmarchaeota archaeon]|nr:hypothetical protein [Candidatus Aenigmarchaeota archaeon]